MLWQTVKDHIKEELSKYIKIDFEVEESKFGDLSTNVCFKIANIKKRNPKDISDEIVKNLKPTQYISKWESLNGYINIYLNNNFYKEAVQEIINLGSRFGSNNKKGNILVEHTSANPNAPLHIGNLRNTIIGNTLANVFRFLGYSTEVQYYVNDEGWNISLTAFGYNIAKGIEPKDQFDIWLGQIYAIMNLFIEIERLKKEASKKYEKINLDNLYKLTQEEYNFLKDTEFEERAKDWFSVQQELLSKFEGLYKYLYDEIQKYEDLEEKVKDLLVSYQKGEEWAVKIVREMVNKCLSEHKKLLKELNARIDKFIFAGDIIWSGINEKIISVLDKAGFIFEKDGAILFDVELAKKKLNINIKDKLPPLILKRSDGTWLYSATDISYACQKIMNFDKSYTIIASEQKLPQTQLQIALKVLEEENFIENAGEYVYIPYELVNLVGKKMSGRRARYITGWEVIKEAIDREYEIIKNKFPDSKDLAEKIGKAAVIYSLAKIQPSKQIVFDINKALDLKENSAPFILYSYVRAQSILRKEKNYEVIDEFNEWEKKLIKEMIKFPEIVEKVGKELEPNILTEYLFNLATIFNEFYENCPIIWEKDEKIKKNRIAILKAFAIVIKNGLNLLGIETVDYM